MNILQIISKNDKYGAQRVFLDQVNILHQMGNQVVVVTRGAQGYVTDSARTLGIDYYGISMNGIKDIFFLRQLIKKYNIDVIHTALDRADYFGLLVSWMTRRPVVSTMHVPRFHIGYRFVDGVLVATRQLARLLRTRGVKPEYIHVVRPGIDVERFSNPDKDNREFWRQKLGTDNYSIIFCHIASMIPRKAHAVSIDLVAECKKRGEEPLLIIIGDPLHGEYYDALVKKIKELRLERNVVFTGWISEIPEILSLSHFTVLPSENEALGIVLMEGMAAGTPIIAREGEGGAELIEEYGSGFLYKPEAGAAEIAEKVVALRRDASRYQALSGKCKKTAADKFSLQRFGERLVNLYQRLE